MTYPDRWAADDVITADRTAKLPVPLEVSPGMLLTHRATGTTGEVVAFTAGARVVLRDALGRRHEFEAMDGLFCHEGLVVGLRAPAERVTKKKGTTASGSVAPSTRRARTARASRIWVEGIHDAELIEAIWGDDLREEGIVVEPLHGADDLVVAVAAFVPSPDRRLGILLDHLIAGTKEHRLAANVANPNVLVAGHPYVDIWQAIRPETIGIAAWPDVPKNTPWKEGIIDRLGFRDDAGVFWRRVLGAVQGYEDVETPLVNSVERLIDFVTEPGT